MGELKRKQVELAAVKAAKAAKTLAVSNEAFEASVAEKTLATIITGADRQQGSSCGGKFLNGVKREGSRSIAAVAAAATAAAMSAAAAAEANEAVANMETTLQ